MTLLLIYNMSNQFITVYFILLYENTPQLTGLSSKN